MKPQTFLVGGAVRDQLLGRFPNDKDFVVVGGTPEWMLSQGFKQVGAAFPVFLHPTTGEEYALARKERKTSPGYTGFTTIHSPDVTLEDDLRRRDLTINSMAMDEGGKLIDPFGGVYDLKSCVLRHTSAAFVEDPLRVLRLARFAARFNFEVALETLDLAREIVQHGELSTLSTERVWSELIKGFSENNSVKFLEVLNACDALTTEPLIFLFLHGKGEKSFDLKSLIDIESTIHQLKIANNHELNSLEVDILLSIPGLKILKDEKLDELSIPSSFKAMGRLFNSLTSSLLDRKIMPNEALELIMKHRLDVNSGKSFVGNAMVATFVRSVHLGHSRFFTLNVQRVDAAIEALRAIDFEKVVLGVKSSDIKNVVAKARQEAVATVLN